MILLASILADISSVLSSIGAVGGVILTAYGIWWGIQKARKKQVKNARDNEIKLMIKEELSAQADELQEQINLIAKASTHANSVIDTVNKTVKHIQDNCTREDCKMNTKDLTILGSEIKHLSDELEDLQKELNRFQTEVNRNFVSMTVYQNDLQMSIANLSALRQNISDLTQLITRNRG